MNAGSLDLDEIVVDRRAFPTPRRRPISALAWAVAVGLNGAALLLFVDMSWWGKGTPPLIVVDVEFELPATEARALGTQDLPAARAIDATPLLLVPAPDLDVPAAASRPEAAATPAPPPELFPVRAYVDAEAVPARDGVPLAPARSSAETLIDRPDALTLAPVAPAAPRLEASNPPTLPPVSGPAAPVPSLDGAQDHALITTEQPSAVAANEVHQGEAEPSRTAPPEAALAGESGTVVLRPVEPVPRMPVRPPDAVVLPQTETAVEAASPASAANVAALSAAGPAEEPEVQRAVNQAILSIPCGRVEAALPDGAATLRLAGHVSSAADRLRLIERVSDLAGLRTIDDRNLYVVGEPYCQVLSFLGHPALTQSADQRFGPGALGAPTQSGVLRLRAGMPLTLQLATPTFASSIYVDYYTSDGRVYHLLPAGDGDHRFAPNLRVAVGGPQGRGIKAVIGPPFGLDMVVALAVETPLQMTSRPAAEGAGPYLQALKTAVESLRRQDEAVRMEFTYYLVLTSRE